MIGALRVKSHQIVHFERKDRIWRQTTLMKMIFHSSIQGAVFFFFLFSTKKVPIFFLYLHGNLSCVYSLEVLHWGTSNENCQHYENINCGYSKTCVREPPLRLTLNSGWCGKSCLSYKGTCHVILLAKLHDMCLYKTTSFPHQPLRSISKVAVLYRFYCSP